MNNHKTYLVILQDHVYYYYYSYSGKAFTHVTYEQTKSKWNWVSVRKHDNSGGVVCGYGCRRGGGGGGVGGGGGGGGLM